MLDILEDIANAEVDYPDQPLDAKMQTWAVLQDVVEEAMSWMYDDPFWE